jgi:hypothetical protein
MPNFAQTVAVVSQMPASMAAGNNNNPRRRHANIIVAGATQPSINQTGGGNTSGNTASAGFNPS